MDAEQILNQQGFQLLREMRDGAYEHLAEAAAPILDQIHTLEAGNRKERRRSGVMRDMLERKQKTFRSQIDFLFVRLSKGYDPTVGASTAVHQEAAKGLATIFG
jgi:hypothetical protein